jgi:O-acetyl-ADP-ribose deacetylase (regulator of RNase III)
MGIRYRAGDATAPSAEGNKIIAHICNDQGAWGRGFVLALSHRWRQPAAAFKTWFREKSGFELGEVQFVQVEPDVWVANMVAQHGLRAQNGVPPIRYEAVRACLEKVADKAKELGATVHMPRIGCGLAGGEWSRIEPIIVAALCRQGIEVTIYDLDDAPA